MQEYLRLLSSALALVDARDAADMAKVKPFAVEVRPLACCGHCVARVCMQAHVRL